MTDLNTELPQEGTANRRESLPTIVGCPTDSGGGKDPLSSQYEETLEGTSPNGENIFRRRDSIPRTPPKDRAKSAPNQRQVSSKEAENPTKKRKFWLSPKKPEDQKTNVGEMLAKYLEGIFRETSVLEKIVNQTYKCKKEFCDASSKLSYYTEKLKSEEIKEWLENAASEHLKDESKNKLLETIQEENQQLRDRIQSLESARKEEVETLPGATANCEDCKNVQKVKTRRQELRKNQTIEVFRTIKEEEWTSEIFQVPQVSEQYIWDSSIDYDIVLPCNADIQSVHRGTNQAIDKFGARPHLKQQNKKPGELAVMSHCLGFPDADGKINSIKKWIYYPILGDPNSPNGNDNNLFNALYAIKKYMVENKRNQIAIPQMEDVTGTIVIRMLKLLLIDTSIQIVVHKTDHTSRNYRERIKSIKDTQDGTRQMRREKPKQDAILIQNKDLSYAELLRSIKSAVNPDKLGVEIKDIKKSRNNDLIISIQNGKNKAESLKKEIREKLPTVKTTLLTSKKVLHIKNMDELTTEAEIKKTVADVIKISEESIEVRALRPAYGGKQNATLIVDDVTGNNLIAMGTIQVGWSQWKIQERQKDARCFVCWGYGHNKVNCKGPNRESLCLKCGKEGHIAKVCKNKPFCVFCNKEGHQSGGQRCQMGLNKEASESQKNLNGQNEGTPNQHA